LLPLNASLTGKLAGCTSRAHLFAVGKTKFAKQTNEIERSDWEQQSCRKKRGKKLQVLTSQSIRALGISTTILSWFFQDLNEKFAAFIRPS
jgi:hypothetical protein